MSAKPFILRRVVVVLATGLAAMGAAAEPMPAGAPPGALEKVAPTGSVTPPILDSGNVRFLREQSGKIARLRQEKELVDAELALSKSQHELVKQRADTRRLEKDPLGVATAAAPGAGNAQTGPIMPQPGMNLPAPGAGGPVAPVSAQADTNRLSLVGTQGQAGRLTATLKENGDAVTVKTGERFHEWQVTEISLLSVTLEKRQGKNVVERRVLHIDGASVESAATGANTTMPGQGNMPAGQPGYYPARGF